MGFSIRDWRLVRSRECVRFSECPLREVLLYMCVQCFMITHKQCCNIRSHHLRLMVAIGYEYMLCCYYSGNVGLHVCAKVHDHTYTMLYAHSKGLYVVIA